MATTERRAKMGVLALALLMLLGVGCPSEPQKRILLPPRPPSTGSGGSAGASGGGGGGGDNGCVEQPCKLVNPQCGCPIGERCVHSMSERRCAPVGGKPAGAACAGDCLAGHICIDNGTGAPPMCHRYCLTNADCVGDGSRCVLDLPGIEEGLCTKDCDPIAQTGCPAAGTKCDVGVDGGAFSQCTGLGTSVQGDPCTTSYTCAAGLTCTSVNAGPTQCYTWCDVDNAVCPAQTACTPFGTPVVIAGTEYGICI